MLQLSFYPQEEDGVTEKTEFWDWAHSSVAGLAVARTWIPSLALKEKIFLGHLRRSRRRISAQ